MKRKLLFILLIFFFSFLSLFFSCDDSTGPPNNNAKLNLTLEDVSCTEVWLKLQVDNPALSNDITIYRDNIEIKKINIIGNDTIIFDEGLLPNKEYTYQAKKIINESEFIESEEVKAQTMDTTSHNFTFETYTFGEHSSSVLYDVAIIDENNIWAVGEIYMNDSLGNPDPIFYNLAIWDGQKWNLRKVYYKYINYANQQDSIIAHLRTIFAFSENDIWFVGIHWNGKDFISKPMNIDFPYQINKIWGTSSNDLYVVGNSGSIAHYQNGRWSKIESGTELNINDIWGDYNEKTGEWEILAVASNYGSNLEKEILLINKNKVQKLSSASNPLMEPLLTTWFIPNRQYYVAGAGIYQKHILQDNFWKHNLFNITTFATTSIRGKDVNDVIGVGAFGDFVHFNGLNWRTDYEEPLLNNGSYTKVAIKGNLIVAVGGNNIGIGSIAIILFGRR